MDVVFTFVAGDKLLDVSAKKYSRLFSCAGEKCGYSQKIVVGGGTGRQTQVRAGFLFAPACEGLLSKSHDMASLLKIEC